MDTFRYFKWNELNFKWNNIDMLWEELRVIQTVYDTFKRKRGSGGGLGTEFNKHWTETYNELKKEDQDSFIKIYCSLNGIDYKEEKVKKKDIKVTVSNLERVFKKVDIKVKLYN